MKQNYYQLNILNIFLLPHLVDGVESKSCVDKHEKNQNSFQFVDHLLLYQSQG